MGLRRIALVLFIVVVAIVGFSVSRDGSLSSGPLGMGDENGLGHGAPLAVGEAGTFASSLLTLKGKMPAVVERVRLLRVTGSLVLIDVLTRKVPDEKGQGYAVGEKGFPPAKYPSRPLAEQHVVPVAAEFSEDGLPLNGLQLVFGLRTTGPGVAGHRGVEVTYRVGDRRYRRVFDDFITLCVPASDYGPGKKNCSDEDRVIENSTSDRTLERRV